MQSQILSFQKNKIKHRNVPNPQSGRFTQFISMISKAIISNRKNQIKNQGGFLLNIIHQKSPLATDRHRAKKTFNCPRFHCSPPKLLAAEDDIPTWILSFQTQRGCKSIDDDSKLQGVSNGVPKPLAGWVVEPTHLKWVHLPQSSW